jgi:hypothetical protein
MSLPAACTLLLRKLELPAMAVVATAVERALEDKKSRRLDGSSDFGSVDIEDAFLQRS